MLKQRVIFGTLRRGKDRKRKSDQPGAHDAYYSVTGVDPDSGYPVTYEVQDGRSVVALEDTTTGELVDLELVAYRNRVTKRTREGEAYETYAYDMYCIGLAA